MIYIVFILFFALLLYVGNAALSIFIGILFTVLLKPEKSFISMKVGTIPLQIGIVILGATISLPYAWSVSSSYLPWISLFVIASFFIGLMLGKILGIHHRIAFLLSAGAAICGGTAMAAIAPIIKAKSEDLVASISLVFLLNAIAIILFPYIGEFFEMTDAEFGIFSALTIHDTASVVGTASLYSDESVTYASIIKLGRTLWIVPLLIGVSIYSKSENKEYEFPYFILVFIAFVVLGNIFNIDGEIKSTIKTISIAFFQIGLFMIGYKFQLHTLMKLSLKPVIFAASIWIIIISITLITFHA